MKHPGLCFLIAEILACDRTQMNPFGRTPKSGAGTPCQLSALRPRYDPRGPEKALDLRGCLKAEFHKWLV